MAGSIGGLQLSIQSDAEGAPLSGAKLYLYEASTSTPVDAFSDYGLTEGNELAWPIEADAAGRLPIFWLADGAYRARLTTSAGVEVFDHASVQALGPSTGGGSGSGSADEEAIFATGDFMWQPRTGARTGWVRANARTIGSASSGATERANADTGALYEHLWNTYTDALCPVTGGRGADAAADFAANKPIGTLDMRGRTIYGLTDMGNADSGVLVTGTPTTVASTIGAEKNTVAQANLPNVTLTVAGSVATFSSVSDMDAAGTGVNVPIGTTGATVSIGGSGTALTTISPGRLGSWFIKL